jgi:hypothetical protein
VILQTSARRGHLTPYTDVRDWRQPIRVVRRDMAR